MTDAAQALIEHSRHLLAAAQEGTEALAPLLDARDGLIEALGGALASGTTLDPTEVGAIEALEQAILNALTAQRDAVAAELTTLRRGRDAGAAYRPTPSAPAIYVDRAG